MAEDKKNEEYEAFLSFMKEREEFFDLARDAKSFRPGKRQKTEGKFEHMIYQAAIEADLADKNVRKSYGDLTPDERESAVGYLERQKNEDALSYLEANLSKVVSQVPEKGLVSMLASEDIQKRIPEKDAELVGKYLQTVQLVGARGHYDKTGRAISEDYENLIDSYAIQAAVQRGRKAEEERQKRKKLPTNKKLIEMRGNLAGVIARAKGNNAKQRKEDVLAGFDGAIGGSRKNYEDFSKKKKRTVYDAIRVALERLGKEKDDEDCLKAAGMIYQFSKDK